MSFQDLTTAAQIYFPSLKISYKNKSVLMKILGRILFFNPSFMTSYITTIGDTIYFPTESFVNQEPLNASIVLMHELVHMTDEKTYTKPVFALSYLFPQILAPLAAILFFFIHWYIALPIMLFFLAPLPAPFRMHWEKRAYIAALYVQQALSQKLNFTPNLPTQVIDDLQQFTSGSYYFMWPFNNIDADFNNAVTAIQAGQRPYNDAVFDMLDKLIPSV